MELFYIGFELFYGPIEVFLGVIELCYGVIEFFYGPLVIFFGTTGIFYGVIEAWGSLRVSSCYARLVRACAAPALMFSSCDASLRPMISHLLLFVQFPIAFAIFCS